MASTKFTPRGSDITGTTAGRTEGGSFSGKGRGWLGVSSLELDEVSESMNSFDCFCFFDLASGLTAEGLYTVPAEAPLPPLSFLAGFDAPTVNNGSGALSLARGWGNVTRSSFSDDSLLESSLPSKVELL